MRALQRSVGLTRPVRVSSGPSGARRTTGFASGEQAGLTLFGAAGGPRLAWRVDYKATSREHYDGVVDASNGRLLWRANRVKSDYSAKVFDYYLGSPPDGPNPPTRVQPLTAPGWLPADRDEPDRPQRAHVVGHQRRQRRAARRRRSRPTGGDFQFDFTPFDRRGAALPAEPHLRVEPGRRPHELADEPQAVGHRGLLHGQQVPRPPGRRRDRLRLGVGLFERHRQAAGAVVRRREHRRRRAARTPTTPTTRTCRHAARRPVADDADVPVRGLRLAGLADFRDINGGDDAGVVWHEYTHGLSNRLVTNAERRRARSARAHAGAMGEAWSDWYASDLLAADGIKTTRSARRGDIDVGDYVDLEPHALRTQAIDCPVGAVVTATPAPAARPPASAATRCGDFGKVAGAPEVHADGEIWSRRCGTCARRSVETGSAADRSDARRAAVTDGMRLSPPEPSMLDMRNAILHRRARSTTAATCTTSSGTSSRNAAWATSPRPPTATTRTRPRTSRPPPDADGPKGTATGRVTDSRLRPPARRARASASAATLRGPSSATTLADETDASGRYTLDNVHRGHATGSSRSSGLGRLRPGDAPNVVVRGGRDDDEEHQRSPRLVLAAGRRADRSVNDDTVASATAGSDKLFDHVARARLVGVQPDLRGLPGQPARGDADGGAFELPQTIDVSAFLIDPSAGCFGDGASATTRHYTLETSADGTTFRTAINSAGQRSRRQQAGRSTARSRPATPARTSSSSG